MIFNSNSYQDVLRPCSGLVSSRSRVTHRRVGNSSSGATTWLVRAATAGVALSMLVALSSGCASHTARAEPIRSANQAHCASLATRCVAAPRRQDVMTWRDYYSSIMDEASRRNGFVIWINPPRPIRTLALLTAPMPAPAAGFGVNP